MTSLYHRVDGAGDPAIVLLNGGMMTTLHWEPVASRLVAAGHRVVRLDLRGQLMSPGLPPPDFTGHAHDVADLLRALDLGPAVVAGTSYGGLVGLVLAAEHPDRVASLVVMNATSRLSPEMVEGTRALRRYAREAPTGGDPGRILDAVAPNTYSPAWLADHHVELVRRRAQMSALPPTWFESLDALLGALEHLDLAPHLPRIAAPVHVVAAERDLTFPLEFSEELARAIPQARLTVVPAAPHGFVIEQPEETARLILESAPPSARPSAGEAGA